MFRDKEEWVSRMTAKRGRYSGLFFLMGKERDAWRKACLVSKRVDFSSSSRL